MRTYSYTVNGARYDVTIESLRDQVAKLNVNGIAFDVEILGAPLTEGDLPEVAGAAVAAPPAGPAPGPPARASPTCSSMWRAWRRGPGTPTASSAWWWAPRARRRSSACVNSRPRCRC